MELRSSNDQSFKRQQIDLKTSQYNRMHESNQYPRLALKDFNKQEIKVDTEISTFSSSYS
uniref:Uncharacterized protein n=1 Tax=Rhizophora mucronata TaxID=61149 RepID=A0A2P2Q6X6_RHIMU